MKYNSPFKSFLKKFFLIFVLTTAFFSCENHRYDSDKRQIMAKDAIESKLHKVQSFDVTGFKEDTIKTANDSNFKKEIRYTLDIAYTDSNKIQQKKQGIVLFTPDGSSIINSTITDQ